MLSSWWLHTQSALAPPISAPMTPEPKITAPIQPENCSGERPKLRLRIGAAQIAAEASAISTAVWPRNRGMRNRR